MGADNLGPTLTDPTGMGGIHAQDGFDYQLWDGLSRLPGWLANPAFEAMIFEGLEDLEARFFAPHAPACRLLERYQAKSGSLTPQDVRGVFEHFHAFEKRYPRVTRVHTLVTPFLPPTLTWVARDVARVRKARPFYAPFGEVLAASDEKLKRDLVEKFGDDLGKFVAENVDVAERVLPDRDSGRQAFSLALERAFPGLDPSARQVSAAFDAVEKLVRCSVGVALPRAELLKVIEAEINVELLPEHAIPVHVRSNRGDSNETAIEIDAGTFSGGGAQFPTAAAWTSGLVEPLEQTARWLTSRHISRVSLSGSYRLTTAFVLGWSFRSAIGFDLDIPTRAGTWATDDRPGRDEAMSSWKITEPLSLNGDRLPVCVGILRRPIDDIVAAGASPATILSISLDEPVPSGKSAQQGVAIVKAAVAGTVGRLCPKCIDLFYAGPAAFAVALGHRWNAMGPTQLHEWLDSSRRYVPTALLG